MANLTRISFLVHDAQIGAVMRTLKDFRVQHLDISPVSEKKTPAPEDGRGHTGMIDDTLIKFLEAPRSFEEITEHFKIDGRKVAGALRRLKTAKKVSTRNNKWKAA